MIPRYMADRTAAGWISFYHPSPRILVTHGKLWPYQDLRTLAYHTASLYRVLNHVNSEELGNGKSRSIPMLALSMIRTTQDT